MTMTMTTTSALAGALLQAGLLMGGVLLLQLVVVRRLPLETVPYVLRGRVVLSNRLRPWLLAAAGTMVAIGLLLELL